MVPPFLENINNKDCWESLLDKASCKEDWKTCPAESKRQRPPELPLRNKGLEDTQTVSLHLKEILSSMSSCLWTVINAWGFTVWWAGPCGNASVFESFPARKLTYVPKYLSTGFTKSDFGVIYILNSHQFLAGVSNCVYLVSLEKGLYQLNLVT